MIDELNEIVPYIKNRKCILFIGAGLSVIAGLYDWDSFVRVLLKHPATGLKYNSNEISESRLGREQLVEYCYSKFKDNGKTKEFWDIVRERLLLKNPKMFADKYLPLIQRIKKIEPFPTTIITTNIDNCLEEARIIEPIEVFYKPNEFTINNLNNGGIFHIHGYIEQVENALLTESKYLEMYKDNNFREFLRQIFCKYSVLFLGYSLRDRKLLEIIFQENKNMNEPHFALFPEDEIIDLDRDPFFTLFRIKIVGCGSKEKYWEILTNWIEKNFMKVSV